MVAAHKARTDVNNVSSMGRDGSGIRMMMWAGATMEAGPRAGQAADINSRPSFPFGGIWPIFGNDGKRFFNETITRHGSVGYLDMMPEGQKMPYITHGFLRADSRNSMGFILLYGKKERLPLRLPSLGAGGHTPPGVPCHPAALRGQGYAGRCRCRGPAGRGG